MSKACLCEVYKSGKEAELYLFVARDDGLERVPESLLSRFGQPQKVTSFLLTPERRLARANAERVLDAICEQGFYLQMPPGRQSSLDAEMAAIRERNRKLDQ
ncbi:MAG: hypothetical protein CMK32_10465 [Porticoccaceae bacterium]|nr:hypothetical protein [Porticoccaceae bacterium]